MQSSRTRKLESRNHEPTAKWFFVGTHFLSCYKCSWESGPDNWIQLGLGSLLLALFSSNAFLLLSILATLLSHTIPFRRVH